MTAPASRWSARPQMIAGALALVVLVLGLGTWGVLARISGAVIAAGVIEVESNRQIIQHPEGGVVGEVMARDGDLVAPGDTLVRLDGTQQRLQLAIVDGQLFGILVRKARLSAERDDAQTVVLSDVVRARAAPDADYAQQLAAELDLFVARRLSLEEEYEQLGEQIRQTENRISGVEAQLGALTRQRMLLEQELENQNTLLDRGLTQAGRVLSLERDQAGIEGEVGRLEAEVAELRGQIAGTRIARIQLRTTRREEAIATLRDLQFQEIELRERRLSLVETLARLDVTAPVGGMVFGSTVFAEKAVVRPADAMMFIVPQDQPLIISARVDATNVDQVSIGQAAVLRFPAFDQRTTPEIEGRILRISPDVVVDETTGASHYAVALAPEATELARLGDLKLVPGMPVEAFIQTGDRSPLAYLTKPLTDYFTRAFRD